MGLLQAALLTVPESTVESLPQAGAESCFPHRIDGALSYNLGLMDSGSDVPLVMIPIYPLPAGMVLLPVPPSGEPASMPLCSPEWVQWSAATPPTRDVSREGPFDAYCSPMDTGDHPFVFAGLSGCPYRISSYTGPVVADTDPAYGIQMHHPRFLEFIAAPESAHLLFRSPVFWVQNMDREDAVAAAINLQCDAGMMSSNLQILGQFVTSLQRILGSYQFGYGAGGFPLLGGCYTLIYAPSTSGC